ncbi:MAG: flagellar hook-basal body complex protein [Planctomycetes bacterium]|nr:flagellar hook-basal body complex protein [Planctomycetota bacterium]
MIQSLFSGISGLKTHQQLLSVVSNNLANVNTVAHKASRALFQDTLSQVVQPPTQSGPLVAGTNGIQIGLGVGLSSVTNLFTQGSLQSTGVNTDLAIEGSGFFVVRDPTAPAGGGVYYTRAGAFWVDANNYLVDSNGYRIQGFQTPDQSAPTVPAAGDPVQDLVIAPDATQTGNMVSFSIESSGRILMQLDDGSVIPVAYIAMNNFTNEEGLLKVGRNLYQETPAANRLFTGYHQPATDGIGAIRAGFLEMSNVDLGTEFTDMIRAQRGLQANSRTITTSDEVLQELINLKR